MWLISLVAVILCSYFLAKMAANLLALQFEGEAATPSVKAPPAPPAEDVKAPAESDDYVKIMERNLFDSKSTGVAAPVNPEAPTAEEPIDPKNLAEAVPTTLKIKLISTFSFGAGTDERSSCIISSGGSGSAIEVYTVNDKKEFAPDTKIVKILFDRVEFIHKGRLEYVMLEDFAQGGQNLNTPPVRDTPPAPAAPDAKAAPEPRIAQQGEGNFVIDRAEIDEALANLDKLYTQIRAVPHFKDGNPNGLKLLSVRAGSIFSKLGLQRGDILQKINGTELDMKRGLELFNQLKSESHITIEIERRGAVKVQEYDIR